MHGRHCSSPQPLTRPPAGFWWPTNCILIFGSQVSLPIYRSYLWWYWDKPTLCILINLHIGPFLWRPSWCSVLDHLGYHTYSHCQVRLHRTLCRWRRWRWHLCHVQSVSALCKLPIISDSTSPTNNIIEPHILQWPENKEHGQTGALPQHRNETEQ